MQHGARIAVARIGPCRTAIAAITVAIGSASFIGVGLTAVSAHASAPVAQPTAQAAPEAHAATVALTTVTSSGGATPTENNPWTVAVTTLVAGEITIATNPTSERDDSEPIADVTITAPAATVAAPLRLTFKVYLGDLLTGTYASDVRIYLDGIAVSGCPSAVASDACVSSTSVAGGVATFTVLSSETGHWQLDTPIVGRLSGSDRFATAAAASQAQFASAGAGAVVLATADDYADALVGVPLAAQKNASLLLTSGSALPAATQAELLRVLGANRRVYLLGGTSAIPASVEAQLTALGYQTIRLAGADRYATAVAVAGALGDPTTVLLATGTDFPDALAAGPAAAHVSGAVLLTSGATMPSETAAYLAAHAETTYAIGVSAAAASPTSHAVAGANRYATAVAVATKFFATPPTFGVAADFPDALAAGALLAHLGAPLLLSGDGAVAGVTLQYVTSIAGSATSAHVFGGSSAMPEAARTAISTALMQESSY